MSFTRRLMPKRALFVLACMLAAFRPSATAQELPYFHYDVAASEIEEYIDLVPSERLPAKHVAPPRIRRNSQITITLLRTARFACCPGYTVTVGTNGIEFEGHRYVVAFGKHTAAVKPRTVRALARKFIRADFYSMNASYRTTLIDYPTYVLSITIDGHKKEVEDHTGQWAGMPGIVSELENRVDTFARTKRWIDGSDGLVAALQAEHFNFKTYEAQVMLKQVLTRGQSVTVREFLDAGVPLQPIPPPEPTEPGTRLFFENVGWLNAASEHPQTLQILLAAGVSRNDQSDKDLALLWAARSGKLEAVQALIAYGANPTADLSALTVEHDSDGFVSTEQGAGSILIYAAESGNPDVVREILRYRPALEARDPQGKTAIFAAGRSHVSDKDGARVECVRLLAEAGANVNARDNDGNTPLHGMFLADAEEALLQLGADVNARNNVGETPIFTNVDEDSIPILIAHGADLTIHNNKGQTVIEAAKEKGPARERALQTAIQNAASRK